MAFCNLVTLYLLFLFHYGSKYLKKIHSFVYYLSLCYIIYYTSFAYFISSTIQDRVRDQVGLDSEHQDDATGEALPNPQQRRQWASHISF